MKASTLKTSSIPPSRMEPITTPALNRRAASRASVTWLATAGLLLMTACASPPKESGPIDTTRTSWTGRMGVTVASEPPQSFSAGFALRGSAKSGELSLTSPLGSTLAVLQWEPGSAVLRQEEQAQRYESLDALILQATGTPIPVGALFAWLNGSQQDIDGWHADLSRLGDGRLFAQRTQPSPPVELRVVLDR